MKRKYRPLHIHVWKPVVLWPFGNRALCGCIVLVICFSLASPWRCSLRRSRGPFLLKEQLLLRIRRFLSAARCARRWRR